MAKEDILQQIEELSVKDLAELVEMFEERFNVSAAMAAPVAVAVAPTEGGGAEAVSETFKVVMTSAGQKKIQVIKEIKEITGKALKECKELVDNLPAVIKDDMSNDEATSIREKLEAAGAEVELQ